MSFDLYPAAAEAAQALTFLILAAAVFRGLQIGNGLVDGVSMTRAYLSELWRSFYSRWEGSPVDFS